MRQIDLAVVALYLVGITWFGARFRRSQRTLRDYFLGGRNAPWWAIAFSIVSAETSTLTVIGTPALAFRGNYGFLQVVLGYLFARIVISTLFLPHYFRGELFTAYELMQRRFGQRLRRLTAGLFLLLRALARLFDLDWRLTIVGSPDRNAVHARSLVALAEELGIARRVRFAGEPVSAASLAAALRSGRLLLAALEATAPPPVPAAEAD